MVCLCLCPCNNVRRLPGEPTGGREEGEGFDGGEGAGGVKHIERRGSSCRPLRAQTCDCCLSLRGQKGVDVVKGRRQS